VARRLNPPAKVAPPLPARKQRRLVAIDKRLEAPEMGLVDRLRASDGDAHAGATPRHIPGNDRVLSYPVP